MTSHPETEMGGKRRPTVLTFVNFYLPGYKAGGPIQSIANLVAHLGDEFEFRIVAGDRDSGDSAPYPGVVPGRWNRVGKAWVRYLSPPEQRLGRIVRILRDTPHDILYLNSFLHPRFTTLPLVARRLTHGNRRPAVIAPRGEFSAGALALGVTKKRAFIAAARLVSLHRDVIWHASTELEADAIRDVMGAVPTYVASDLPRPVPASPPPHEARSSGAPLRIIFLSRVSPMKNLHFLLEVLREVRSPVHLRIAGFIAVPAYWAQCQEHITRLPPHVTVDYVGTADPSEVPCLVAESDLFALPTLGENFGHAIIEALGAGTPVLLSDQTPWHDVGPEQAGWALPLSERESFVRVIEEVAAEAPEEAVRRREAAFAYARRFQERSAPLDDNRRFLTDLVRQGKPRSI